MKTATFTIDGMLCDGCASTVKTLIERQPGVQMATVSFADRQALIAAIGKPGFRVVKRNRHNRNYRHRIVSP